MFISIEDVTILSWFAFLVVTHCNLVITLLVKVLFWLKCSQMMDPKFEVIKMHCKCNQIAPLIVM